MPNLNAFEKRFPKSGVFYLGHASIMAVLNGRKILFDPIVLSKPYDESWSFYPPQIRDESFHNVDAVVVSHIHQDHYDVEFLKSLAPQAKLIIVGGRPEFESDIKSKAQRTVNVIEPERTTEIFDGVFLHGVNHETNGVDASTIAFDDRFCVYHGNDNYLSAEGLSKFKAPGRAVDVACVPYAFIHWYPFLLDCDGDALLDKQTEGQRLVDLYMDDCIRAIEILNPKLAIPFGANLLLQDGNAFSEMNLAVKTPFEFFDHAAAKSARLADVVRPLLAGDYCGLHEQGFEVVSHSRGSSGDYRLAADAYLKSLPAKRVGADKSLPPVEEFVDKLNQKISGCDHEASDNLVQMELKLPQRTLKIEIDCRSFSAAQVREFSRSRATHQFTLDEYASMSWLEGRRFEEIIGMRRFRLKRTPNVYASNVLKFINTAL